MKSVIASLLLCLVAASPSVAGDLTDDLVALEKAGWTAWSKGDAQAFNDLISEDAYRPSPAVVLPPGGTRSWPTSAATVVK